MTAKEHKKYLKEFKEYSKEVTSSKEKATRFLYEAGIITKKGRLTKSYTLASQ